MSSAGRKGKGGSARTGLEGEVTKEPEPESGLEGSRVEAYACFTGGFPPPPPPATRTTGCCRWARAVGGGGAAVERGMGPDLLELGFFGRFFLCIRRPRILSATVPHAGEELESEGFLIEAADAPLELMPREAGGPIPRPDIAEGFLFSIASFR